MLNRRNILVGAVLALSLVAFLWFVPYLQGRYFSESVPAKELPALVNEYRRTWAQIIGGLALLLGLYATLRRVEIAERTLEATQDQQVTERFTRAIDQLGATDDAGNPRLEIRLGGIYALERIARDSPERDYSTVMEVLTTYVRENAPWNPKSTEQEGAKGSAEPTPQTPRADIEAILDVLGRREVDRVPEENNIKPLVLWRTDLRGAQLFSPRLERAVLDGAHLERAVLFMARLERARLVDAHLERAGLLKAHLEGTLLDEAHLEGADLSGARGLTQEQINEAYGDETTKLPEGLERPAHWSKSTDEQQNGEE